MEPLPTRSGILYVRAALKPFVREIKSAGGIVEFLQQYWNFDELFVPYFNRARFFWEKPPEKVVSNSGALGSRIAAIEKSIVSLHPTHKFAGLGNRVASVLKQHDHTKSCFFPIKELAEQNDFSMLLLGCCDESPGFSTVHAVQNELGLTRKHLFRYLKRWDVYAQGKVHSIVARESPGCSLSFGKFYQYYRDDGNFVQGNLNGVAYIFIPSALRAMTVERDILSRNPRFVTCDKEFCLTCRLRLY